MQKIREWVMTSDEHNHPNGFYNKIANYLGTLGCNPKVAIVCIHDAQMYGYSVCDTDRKGVIVLSTNVYRNTISANNI